MTTDEGLLQRWSRRKQAAKAAPPPAAPEPEEVPVAEADLPPIESLGLTSDYTAFLQQGVAAEVQRRALQRAWQSDDRISAFRGMGEYAWDFNAPQYGRLWAADDAVKLVQAVLTPPSDEAPPSIGPTLAAEQAPLPLQSCPAESKAIDPVPDLVVEAEPAPKEISVRRHGSALPC